MEQWAILSGIEGNLGAYEAVLADIRRQRVSDLYILGDFVGFQGDNEAVIQRLQSPEAGELEPQICIGWWEEQCFNLYGLGGLPDAPELVEQEGADAVQRLWESVSRQSVQWMRSLHFGFHELDCLLIHGSTVGYADVLTPDTPAMQLCDRLIRADANHLFCGRSGRTFECWVTPTQLNSTVTTLDGTQPTQDQSKSARRVIGVGSVGCNPGEATYTLYSPGSNQLSFRTVNYGQAQYGRTKREKVKGFGS
ncbi:metallophosphoesterase family protein [Acaryochloris marina]|uniref:metallophosphoesterase family protein n=1 Tax=Acaryochloris marina TaxID=155978 RepID=UPI0021C38252|nr:metallophosphatase [Acaryochloris marina]BDM82766.1 phosphoesterase [Acaryochloris marina MBIC10699]